MSIFRMSCPCPCGVSWLVDQDTMRKVETVRITPLSGPHPDGQISCTVAGCTYCEPLDVA